MRAMYAYTVCVLFCFVVKVGTNQQPISILNGNDDDDDDNSTLSLILLIVFTILAVMIIVIIIYAIAHYMYLRTQESKKPPVEA